MIQHYNISTLQELRKRRPWIVTRDIASVYLQIFVGFGLCAFLPNILGWSIGFILIGTGQVQLANLLHHGSHGDLSKSSLVNDFLTRIFCSGPTLLPFSPYQFNHFRHHHLMGSVQDHGFNEYYDLNHPNRVTGYKFITWIIKGFVGGMLYTQFLLYVKHLTRPHHVRQKSVVHVKYYPNYADYVSILIGQLFFFLVSFLVIGNWWSYFILWLLPLFTIQAGITNARACLEHADLSAIPKRIINFSPAVLEIFAISRFNIHLHGYHHLTQDMKVPYYNVQPLIDKLAQYGKDRSVQNVGGYCSRIFELVVQLNQQKTRM